MNIIRRDVFVLTDKLKTAIKYVQGTDTIPIVFKYRDFTIPEGTTAEVYVRKLSGKEVNEPAEVNTADNTVTVDVTKQMTAEAGMADLQIILKSVEGELYSFTEILDVKRSIVAISSETGSSILDEYIRRINELVTIALNATQEKAEYAETQGNYAKEQGDYAKDQAGYAKGQGDYAKTEAISIRSEFEDLKSALAGTENGELLLEINRLLEDMYRIATETDINRIIDGTYVEEDEGGIFESGTAQDIDNILGGSFVEEPESEDADEAQIQGIVDSLFK